MEKNNLDNLFKDKFKDFSENPDERVWENIEASLNKKKKKRVVPIWWQLGGVAALLVVLLSIINPFSADENTDVPTAVNTEQETPNASKDSPTIEGNVLDTKVADEEGQMVSAKETNSGDGQTKESYSSNTSSQSAKKQPFQTGKTHDAIAVSHEVKPGTTVKNPSNQNQNLPDEKAFKAPGDEVITATDTNENNPTQKLENTSESRDKTAIVSEEQEAIAENTEEAGKSIFEAIEEQKQLDKEAIASNDLGGKWSVGPSVAPVYFNSIGEGSPIHSNFASNSKSGKFNLSYGLTVAYNISKKLSIRSGVHKVDYSYDTNDVVFTSSLTTSTSDLISNINYAQTSKNLVVGSKQNSNTAALNDNPEVVGELSPFEGSMVQQIGYIEVPMELNYALVDNKFGINLIGGVSSLFLVDNAVSLESEQLVTEIGEANNANSVNFSTNIGLGLNYTISPKIQLNLEPMFKYQLNTFSDTAGSFRPYSIGVYSGLRFRF